MSVRKAFAAATLILAGLFTSAGTAAADNITVGSEVPDDLTDLTCIPADAQPVGVDLTGLVCDAPAE
ncbi:hypothetical protein [Goodfellowiella coeruleoviolacea]|uniref:Uncharacterized protein n=1 Tax=Goodfellowiella coeruleoviolacea TaxID=334858 RepID=A0AAE3GI66_9PSEU|nr:hypothetical protein [Goodfellowiella coeruleoviolacea]MCP2168662.1 hypothetical protein [Goodfellowiella coeruleoviolacea]